MTTSSAVVIDESWHWQHIHLSDHLVAFGLFLAFDFTLVLVLFSFSSRPVSFKLRCCLDREVGGLIQSAVSLAY